MQKALQDLHNQTNSIPTTGLGGSVGGSAGNNLPSSETERISKLQSDSVTRNNWRKDIEKHWSKILTIALSCIVYIQTDHIPDSSGHIPYRIGRPGVHGGGPPPLSQTVSPQAPLPAAILTDYDSIPYHLNNYGETEKWHKWDLEYGKNTIPYNSTRVQRKTRRFFYDL